MIKLLNLLKQSFFSFISEIQSKNFTHAEEGLMNAQKDSSQEKA